MSLNDLLPLLFVAAFVVNAIVRGRRAQRRREVTREREPAPGREASPRPEPRTDPGAEDRPRRAEAGEDGGADGGANGSAGDDLQSRIEEARRRVREAMGDTTGGEPAGGGHAEATRPQTPTTGRPGGTSAPAAGGFLGREGTDVSRAEPAAPGPTLGRQGPPSRDTASAKPSEPRIPKVARRRHPSRSAKLRAAKGLGTDRDDIVRGFVWSVVFEDPVANRMRRRRTISPRRSP